ncbi:MAG TPA: DNA-processing protein DprA [Candidatus Binatia bacterium]|nr:DNA-processing protein DprA [Candidatus Binatia bacterium]
MITGFEICEIKPPASLGPFFDGKPPRIWGVGEPTILDGRLLGIISARQIDSDLASKSSELLKTLPSLREVAFIGGWHSPLEEEALHILAAKTARIILCIPKALNRFLPSDDIANRVTQRQVLLLTHCSPKAKRISRNASIRRNQLVVGLANALLVLSAPAGSVSLKLAISALRRGKPVLTPEQHMNKELLECGALPATFDNVQAALR